MYRVKNTAEDRTKHLLHRTASQFELEPSLGGTRIRLGTFIDITDEHYARVKPLLDSWVLKGMVEVFPVLQDGTDVRKFVTEPQYDANSLKLGGPTIEEWMSAGFSAETYPPTDFAEVPSIGLSEFRMNQEKIRKEAADLAVAQIKEELNRPSTMSQILPAIPVQEPEVLPEPVIHAPEPTPVAPPVVQAPPAPVSNRPQEQNKNKKLR